MINLIINQFIKIWCFSEKIFKDLKLVLNEETSAGYLYGIKENCT